MSSIDYQLFLELEKPEVYLGNEEPDDFLYEYQGQIVGVDGDEHRVRLGRFRVFYVDAANGFDAGLNACEVLDGRQETCPFMDLFDIDINDFTEQIQRLCEYELIQSNILVIDRLEVLPRFRGKGVGAEIVKGLIRRFGHGASLAALKAFPLQLEKGYPTDAKVEAWRKRMGLEVLPQDTATAKRSLKAFYKGIGFIQVPKSDLMIANLARRLP